MPREVSKVLMSDSHGQFSGEPTFQNFHLWPLPPHKPGEDAATCWQCVAVCCSVLQCVAMCCRLMTLMGLFGSVLQCVAVCCSVLQYVAVFCSVLQCVTDSRRGWGCIFPDSARGFFSISVLQRVAACCSVLQRVAVCCSVVVCCII